MRITNNMLINNMMNNIGKNLVRMNRFQDQLATGKKISVPSDDPVVAARALKLRTDVAQIDQYKRNVKDAQSWLDITENALANMGDILHRARELAVQSSNGTNAPEDMKQTVEEIKQLKTQLAHLGNTTYAGRNVFSGFSTDEKLIDEKTGRFMINVTNTENITFEIGIGDDMHINVAGGDLFNRGTSAFNGSGTIIGSGMGAGAAGLTITTGINDQLDISLDGDTVTNVTIAPGTYETPGDVAKAVETAINGAFGSPAGAKAVRVIAIGDKLQLTRISSDPSASISIDSASNAASDLGLTSAAEGKSSLIQVLDNFIEGLENGSHAAVNTTLGELDKEIENILRIRADIGARQNRLELTAYRLDSDSINFTKLMSENENVDMAETIMNLQNEENVYRASLAGGARIIQPSLVDFLR